MMWIRTFSVAALVVFSAAAHAKPFKIATIAPDGTAWMREMRAAGAELKTATEGRVELKFFPGGAMGSDATVLRKMKLGQLQGAALSGSELATAYPDAQIMGLPFLFRSQAEVDRVRPFMDPKLREGLAKAGLVAPGISGGGFAYVMSTRPIKTNADLIQSKVWVPLNDRVTEVTFATAQVKPVPLSIADVYTSLQTGMVDTVGNTAVGVLAFQWFSKLKHMVDLPATYVMGYLVFNRRDVEALSTADQAALNRIVGAAFKRLDEINTADNLKARETLKKEGIQFFTPDAAGVAYWNDVGARATETMLNEGLISRELFAALKGELERVRAQP
jgi:TRAP-type transport system periplasmic protein